MATCMTAHALKGQKVIEVWPSSLIIAFAHTLLQTACRSLHLLLVEEALQMLNGQLFIVCCPAHPGGWTGPENRKSPKKEG